MSVHHLLTERITQPLTEREHRMFAALVAAEAALADARRRTLHHMRADAVLAEIRAAIAAARP
ncbi:MAG: hypothetical protein K2X46_15045 [Roseomonas sp.]|nr:hypothetical protein [Roseomonas sp.]